MNNKEIVLTVAEAFNKNDAETILKYFADDGEWNMIGDKVYSGKDTLSKMFSENPEITIVNCTQDHVITDGDTVAIDGFVEMKGKNDEVKNMFYCDIYQLADGRVKKMISYCIDKKN